MLCPLATVTLVKPVTGAQPGVQTLSVPALAVGVEGNVTVTFWLSASATVVENVVVVAACTASAYGHVRGDPDDGVR
jgi:hypothetical protein